MILPNRNAKDGKERDAKRVEIGIRIEANETMQLVYTRDNFLRPGSSRQFILSNIRQKVQQDPYGGNQHTIIKGMWFGCKLSDTFEGYGKRTFEAYGKKVFEVDYKRATFMRKERREESF